MKGRIPHPIPYQGSKRALADSILAFLPKDTDVLFEPFAGSAALTLAAASSRIGHTYRISDKNRALMELWSAIIKRPDKLADQYESLWSAQEGRELPFYNEVRERFNRHGDPADFLFLLARCVKASVRYNQRGEFNQSPDKRRCGTRPETMRANLVGASRLLSGRSVACDSDYKAATEGATPADLIYFDPPYQGVSGKRDARYCSGVDFDEFVDHLDDLNRRGLSFLLSYDGRTGEKVYGRPMPAALQLRRIEVEVGRSSQATLLGRNEITIEALYVSPALMERITFSPVASICVRPPAEGRAEAQQELFADVAG